MISLLLLFNSQTKVRLQKWYKTFPDKVKKEFMRDIVTRILTRRIPCSNFIEWKDYKIVYQRYANLFFCLLIDHDDNELISLEMIQRYVEVLDQYFGNVCELDIIFNFEKAHFVWNELVVAGELLETSRRAVIEAVLDQDDIQREEFEKKFEGKLLNW